MEGIFASMLPTKSLQAFFPLKTILSSEKEHFSRSGVLSDRMFSDSSVIYGDTARLLNTQQDRDLAIGPDPQQQNGTTATCRILQGLGWEYQPSFPAPLPPALVSGYIAFLVMDPCNVLL